MSTEFTTLIDVAALRRALASPTPPLLLDSRFDLTDPADAQPAPARRKPASRPAA